MELYKIENYCFAYPESKYLTLSDINLKIDSGEFILLVGRTGSGKTTFLRSLKSALTPSGLKSGNIRFEGKPLESVSLRDQAEKIGFVSQNPDFSVVTDRVYHELAFTLESLGKSREYIKKRLAETASFLGIGDIFEKKCCEISGGEKQLAALGSVLCTDPNIIILDEPLSMLDPVAKKQFVSALVRIKNELGVSVLVSEHNAEEILPFTDRIIVMSEGRVVTDDEKYSAIKSIKNEVPWGDLGVTVNVFKSVNSETIPVTIAEGRAMLESFEKKEVQYTSAPKKEAVITVRELYFAYDRPILKGIDFDVKKGEIFAITGLNGSGKSTLLALLAGIIQNYSGKISTDGKLAYIPQDPHFMFSSDVLENEEIDDTDTELGDILKLNPYDLSGGELQTAAIAKALSIHPDIILADEPTKGLDCESKKKIGDLLKKLTKKGKTIIIVSHDPDFCAKYADRCALLFNGEFASAADTRKFFTENALYTCSAVRLAKGFIKNAITDEEIIKALNGKVPSEEKPSKTKEALPPNMENTLEIRERTTKKRILLSLPIIMIAIPILIFLGVSVFDDRKYYFISSAIMLLALIPFLSVFENRAIRARELVLIAVLCGMCVVGRLAFFMTAAFKPVTACVIIAGVAVGAECGFAVGAMGSLISNFYFGQGPWTPWQTLSYGIIGFLSGILARSELLKKNKVQLAVFGFFCVMLIYGGIMNPASVIMSQEEINVGKLLYSYATGIPFDLIHASGTSIFLFFLSEPVIKRLDRVVKKYGINVP